MTSHPGHMYMKTWKIISVSLSSGYMVLLKHNIVFAHIQWSI